MTMVILAAGCQRSLARSACRGDLCVLRGFGWLLQRVKMMEKLWGDNFFDPSTKKWTKKHTGTASCKRGFVQFGYEPIKTIIDACMNDNKAKLWAMTDKLAITGKLKAEDKELVGKPLMKRIMQSWLPAHEVPPLPPLASPGNLAGLCFASGSECICHMQRPGRACSRCFAPAGSPCTSRLPLAAVHASPVRCARPSRLELLSVTVRSLHL